MTPTPYVYNAVVTSNYDGDTLTATLDLGMGMTVKATCRLLGLDTPEMKSAQKDQAKKAKTRLKELLGDGSVILHSTQKPDKYGRLLVLVYKDGICANEVLIQEGLARAYDGGAKSDWSA